MFLDRAFGLLLASSLCLALKPTDLRTYSVRSNLRKLANLAIGNVIFRAIVLAKPASSLAVDGNIATSSVSSAGQLRDRVSSLEDAGSYQPGILLPDIYYPSW